MEDLKHAGICSKKLKATGGAGATMETGMQP